MSTPLEGTTAVVTGASIGMEAEDIADAVVYVVTRPRRAAVNEMLVRPTEQTRQTVAPCGPRSRSGRRPPAPARTR